MAFWFHISKTGEKVWTVRAGTQRILDVFTLRTPMDIGDTYGEGYVRFTIRSNIEYMVGRWRESRAAGESVGRRGFPSRWYT